MYEKVRLTDLVDYHIKLEKEMVPMLAFDENKDYAHQKSLIDQKFRELVKVPERKTHPEPLIEKVDNSDPRFDEIRFCIESEPGFYVPAHLLLPKERQEKVPLVICLQGHSAGMHISMGREAYPDKTPIEIEGDRDFALQAVAHGYGALAMEQRGFGELLDGRRKEHKCHLITWQAMMMGRTLVGERILDIQAMLDAVAKGFDFIDMDRIGITGNSAGGTAAYYAACVDERIKVAMPSSCFGSFADSWGSTYHCDCGYIPDILKYLEMCDLAVMIAPRPLIIVNGIYDHLQPFEGVQKGFETVKKIYEAAAEPDKCNLVIGEEGHRFYAEKAWAVFNQFI